MGLYLLWRDLGYAAGAVIAEVVADIFGLGSAVLAVMTLLSGVIVRVRMRGTH